MFCIVRGLGTGFLTTGNPSKELLLQSTSMASSASSKQLKGFVVVETSKDRESNEYDSDETDENSDDDDFQNPDFEEFSALADGSCHSLPLRGLRRTTLRIQLLQLNGDRRNEVVRVRGRFGHLFSHPWWTVTVEVKESNFCDFESVSIPSYSPRVDELVNFQLISVFLTRGFGIEGKDSEIQHVNAFIKFMRDSGLKADFRCIVGHLASFGETSESNSIIARQLYARMQKSEAGKALLVPGFTHYAHRLLPRHAESLFLNESLETLKGIAVAIKDEPWILGYQNLVRQRFRVFGCEVSLKSFENCNLLDAMDSDKRDALCVYDTLQKKTSRYGDTYVPLWRLKKAVSCTNNALNAALRYLYQIDIIGPLESLKGVGEIVYLTSHKRYEMEIAQCLARLITQEERQRSPKDWGINEKDFGGDTDQIRAARMIASNPVTVISGKGGCGKTHVVSKVFGKATSGTNHKGIEDNETDSPNVTFSTPCDALPEGTDTLPDTSCENAEREIAARLQSFSRTEYSPNHHPAPVGMPVTVESSTVVMEDEDDLPDDSDFEHESHPFYSDDELPESISEVESESEDQVYYFHENSKAHTSDEVAVPTYVAAPPSLEDCGGEDSEAVVDDHKDDEEGDTSRGSDSDNSQSILTQCFGIKGTNETCYGGSDVSSSAETTDDPDIDYDKQMPEYREQHSSSAHSQCTQTKDAMLSVAEPGVEGYTSSSGTQDDCYLIDTDDEYAKYIMTVVGKSIPAIESERGLAKKAQKGINMKEGPILLTAPTGKAATILGKRTNLPSFTLHHVTFSYFNYLKAKNKKEKENSKEEKESWRFADVRVLICDECSLISIKNFANLVGILTRNTKLSKVVMLGDVNQLPSIEPGNFFKDVFKALENLELSVTLTTNHRAESQLIVDNAERISKQLMPHFPQDATQCFVSKCYKCQAVGEKTNYDLELSYITVAVNELLPKEEDSNGKVEQTSLIISEPKTSQFIAFQKKVCNIINERCAQAYQGHAIRDPRGRRHFQVGDKVCIRRSYACFELFQRSEVRLCNGDIFFIKDDITETDQQSSKKTKRRMFVLDDGERVLKIDYVELKKAKLDHAWARTIHTFQGSEVDTVVYVVGSSYYQNWQHVYTAVTRGRRQVVIINNPENLRKAIERPHTKRNTRLHEFLFKATRHHGSSLDTSLKLRDQYAFGPSVSERARFTKDASLMQRHNTIDWNDGPFSSKDCGGSIVHALGSDKAVSDSVPCTVNVEDAKADISVMDDTDDTDDTDDSDGILGQALDEAEMTPRETFHDASWGLLANIARKDLRGVVSGPNGQRALHRNSQCLVSEATAVGNVPICQVPSPTCEQLLTSTHGFKPGNLGNTSSDLKDSQPPVIDIFDEISQDDDEALDEALSSYESQKAQEKLSTTLEQGSSSKKHAAEETGGAAVSFGESPGKKQKRSILAKWGTPCKICLRRVQPGIDQIISILVQEKKVWVHETCGEQYQETLP